MKTTQLYSKETSSYFSKLGKTKKDFIKWTLRQYFADPGCPWYNPDIREDNVLAFLSRPDNGFPHTPVSMVNIYRLKQSLHKSIGKVTDEELDEVIESQEKHKKQSRYHKGEADLREVSSSVGNYTNSMISKISYEAIDKIKSLTKGKDLAALSFEEEESLERKLENDLDRAATVYSEILHISKNHEQVIAVLRKLKLLKASEVDQIGEDEIEWINENVGLEASYLKEFLLADIDQDDNFMKTFQMVYSKVVYGRKKDRHGTI